MKRAAVLTVVMAAILFSLGCWQLQRLEWKEDLLARLEARMEMPAVNLPTDIDNLDEWEFRRVRVSGKLLNRHEFLLKPRTQDGKAGYHLITPMLRKSGDVVFVNRGFVDDAGLKKVARPSSPVTIEGLVRLPEKRFFTPENNPAKGDWYWPDLAAMAKAADVKRPVPALVSVLSAVPEIPNNHRQYAIFWFGMTFILLVIYFLYSRRKYKE